MVTRPKMQMAMRVLVLALVARAHGLDVLDDALVAAERADEPFFMPTALDVPQDLTLRAILEPFAGRLEPPFVKYSDGAGEPPDDAGAPRSVNEALGMIVMPRAPNSMMLRLEELTAG